MSETRENDPAPVPPLRSEGEGDDQIRLRLHRPVPGQVVLQVGGEALDDVTFLGTSGLAVLIELREAAHSSGVQLRLACTARRVVRPLAIAGLVSLFDMHATVDEALAPT
jgi:anti-sigma B factor antagonist